MEKIPSPSPSPSPPPGQGKVPGRAIALVVVIALVAALIAFFLGKWQTGVGDGSSIAPNQTASSTSSDKHVVQVRVLDKACSIQQGPELPCASACDALKARDDKDKLIVEIDITDGIVNEIQALKDCLNQADMKFTTTRR